MRVSRAVLFLVAALAIASAGFGGCSRGHGGAPRAAPAPRRIVSLAPALTEILFFVGAGPRVVGVTDYCDFPPEAARLPKVGGYLNPSVEAVLALEPDLVLVNPGPGNREAAFALSRAGVRVEVVPAETLEETYRAIETVGAICGEPERGRELSKGVRKRIETVSERVRSLKPVRTLFCVQVDPIVAAGRGTLPGELLELAGGENVIRSGRYPRLGIESVISLEPEVILQAPMDEGGGRAKPDSFWRRFGSIPAVARGRVHIVDPDLVLRPGPRVADGIEVLADLLHGGGKDRKEPS